MSQEPMSNRNEKGGPRFGNRPNSEEPGQSPRKGPKFSIYWIYAIIFAVLIGFNFFNFSSNTASVDQGYFQQMLKAGDVEKYVVISNRNLVKIYIKKSSLAKYSDCLLYTSDAADE